MARSLIILALLAGIIVSIFAIYPQMRLESRRGAEFNGAFATYDLDEMAYGSYLQALIDGRGRRNDPYTGRDHSPDTPQPESLFSIQFATAYMAAGMAAVLGYGAWEVMPVISVVSAFFTAIAVFLLIFSITREALWAFAGALMVLTGAAAISGLGAFNSLFDGGTAYPYFPFLRRHIPSMSFPFMFSFFLFLWLGITPEGFRERLVWGALSVACFAVLVFSYFYLWTSAGAVLAGLVLFTIIFNSERRTEDLKYLVGVGVGCVLMLIPYVYLLSQRNEMMDKAQLLVYTRQPDLFRNVEIYGAIILVGLAALFLTHRSTIDRRVLAFLAGLALSPILVFNQQILTGRSLQPFHYEYYVINYVVLTAVVIAAIFLIKYAFAEMRHLSLAAAVALAVGSTLWGGYEAVATTKFWDGANAVRDDAMPVNLRLRELAAGDIDESRRVSTLNLEPLQADSQPTVAPHSVLWARHQNVFVGLRDWEENKTRYFKLIYYSDLDGDWLRGALRHCSNIEACMALFGWDRFNATLSADARPLTLAEVDEEVERYEAFSNAFSHIDAAEHSFDFLVARISDNDPLVNVRKWFELDEGEDLGRYRLYRATLRDPDASDEF